MNENTILITGAFSGIGKAFVRAYRKDPLNKIIALDKNFPHVFPPDKCDGDNLKVLNAYRRDVGDEEEPHRVQINSMDVTDEAQLSEICKLQRIDIVIHSAGVRGLVPSVPINRGADVATAETMDVMTSQTLQETFHINTVGTFLLLRTLTPILLRTKGAKVIVMGSRMGSIGHNSAGGGYAYRASKAALNAVVKSFSIDVPDVCFVTVHPGRVESNLVGEGVREEGAVSADESVGDLLGLISKLQIQDSGRFVDRFGDDIVW